MAKIIQKWSLEVVAVPQEEIRSLSGSTTSDKTIPIKVKIRIKRGKNNKFCRERVISVPKIEQANEYTEKVRIVHSDQTIMSFNMLTKSDHKSKTNRKAQNKFFHLFKTGKCLSTQGEDENDPPYLIATTVKSNQENSAGQATYEKQNIRSLQNKYKTLEEVTKQPVIFLGKCKPGGCLDPPFGEDRYRYEPSIKPKQEPDVKNKENYEVVSYENESEKKTKRSEVTLKISNYEEINTLSTFMLYKANSEKSLSDGKYSDSIITYPPDTSPQDIGSLEKSLMIRKSSAVKNRLSSNITDTYFMPPKIDKSPERNTNRNKMNINSYKESNDYYRSGNISDPEDREAKSLLLERNDLHLDEVPKNIVLDVEELKEPVPPLKIETENSYEIDKKYSKLRTVHSLNDFQIPISQSIDDTKSQIEKVKELNKFRASTDDVLSKTVKLTPQIRDEVSPLTIENQISDNFAQEYFNSYTPDDPVQTVGSEIAKVQYAELKTPSFIIQTSTSNKSNLSLTSLKNNIGENNITLPQTMKNETIESKSTGSYIDSTITSSKNYIGVPGIKCKYDDDIKLHIIKKVSSANIHTISKSNIDVHVAKSSPTQSNLSDVTFEQQTNKQGENMTNELFDRTVLQTKDIQDSHTVRQKLQSELISNSLIKIKEKSPILSSNDYNLEIQARIDKSQLDHLSESFSRKAGNSKSKYEDNDHHSTQDYEEFSDLQENDETSNDVIHKQIDYHLKDISTEENSNGNISATAGDSENYNKIIHQDSPLLVTSPSTNEYFNNEAREKISPINSHHIPLDKKSKSYSTAIENKIIDIDNYTTQKDSITNLKQNIETERLFQNKIVTENFVPIETRNILSRKPTSISIEHAIDKNESDYDFQNNRTSTSSINNKNGAVDKLIENNDVIEEKPININKMSLTNESISVPVEVSNKTIPILQYSKNDKSFNGSNDISRQDLMSHTRKDLRISFEDNTPYIAKFSLENDANKVMIVDLAFQTYVNDNNEEILRTIDNSIEPQRFPHDNISVIKSALEFNNNNKLSFTINSKTKISIEIDKGSDIPTETEERSHKSKENIANELDHIENNKHIELREIEKLQRSLSAIYENDLIPVENLIRNLITEVDKIAKYRCLIKNKLTATKKRRLSKQTNCNKRCECLRK